MNTTDRVPLPPRPVPGSTAGKVQPHHLNRLAVVYVRQSTPKEVLDNRESTARQYQLVDRAAALRWRPDRVLVIDDDLGQSGRTAADRAGFQRLLAEIGLNHVGLILGTETSRLAPNLRAEHRLVVTDDRSPDSSRHRIVRIRREGAVAGEGPSAPSERAEIRPSAADDIDHRHDSPTVRGPSASPPSRFSVSDDPDDPDGPFAPSGGDVASQPADEETLPPVTRDDFARFLNLH